MTAAGTAEHRGSDSFEATPVTAFVSWAHDDESWQRAIARFVLKLRDFGIDADVDLFHMHDVDVNWATYGPLAIEDNDFVLIAVSHRYKDRWEGRSDPRTGAGAVREANVLRAIFDEDRREFQRKVKLVLLPGATPDDIPRELRTAVPHFRVDTFDRLGLEDLLRMLTCRPILPINPVGEVPLLPPTLLGTAPSHSRTPQEVEHRLDEHLSEVKQRLESASPDDTAGREDLTSEKSTIEAALSAVRERDRGSPEQVHAGDLIAGTEIGGYRIERVIAHGGQGVVYVATQLALERRVALKVIPAEIARRSSLRERFQREAHAAANIDHENVLPVYDSGELPDGTLFLAMKLVHGTDLGTVLGHRGTLDPTETLDLLAQVARALDAAHGAGLIHRDVKPANVLLERRGDRTHAYLSDFGLARPLHDRDHLTSYGERVGTAAYMAPEQIRDLDIDGRVDVYAFGCTLYECLTGQQPFHNEAGHLEAPIPLPSNALPGIPPAYDDAVSRALAKDPAHRPRSAGELIRRLEDQRQRHPARPVPALRRRTAALPARRVAVHAVGYAALLAAAYLVGRSL